MFAPLALRYDASLIAAVVRAYWWRLTGFSYFLTLLLLAVALGALMLLDDGRLAWLIGLLTGVELLATAIPIAGFVAYRRRALERLHAMTPPQIDLTLAEDNLSLASNLATSTMMWAAIKEVWRQPHFWLLFVSRGQFITLPLTCVPPPAQAFVLERVKAGGGKIA